MTANTIRVARRRSRAGAGIRIMFAMAAVLALATTAGVLAAGGTYAYFSDASPVGNTVRLTAGTATLAVSAGSIDLSGLYPGQSRSGSYTITNTGDVPLAVSISSISGPTAANALTASMGVTCSGPQSSSGSFGLPTLAKGASATICLTVGMSADAPLTARGLTTALSIALEGVQV